MTKFSIIISDPSTEQLEKLESSELGIDTQENRIVDIGSGPILVQFVGRTVRVGARILLELEGRVVDPQ